VEQEEQEEEESDERIGRVLYHCLLNLHWEKKTGTEEGSKTHEGEALTLANPKGEENPPL
jgi:hypothetical protein